MRNPSKEWLDVVESDVPSFAVSILAKMRSPAASERIEKLFFTSQTASQAQKKQWFTFYLLNVRNDPAIVGLYKSLLTKGIEDDVLRNTAVQTVFDYKPGP